MHGSTRAVCKLTRSRHREETSGEEPEGHICLLSVELHLG